MESGIIELSEFRKINNKMKTDYYDLVSAYDSLNEELKQVKSYYSGEDIKYLYQNYNDQLYELKKVNSKVNVYYSNTSDILYAYHNQEQEIARAFKLYLNKIKEDLKNGRN